MQYFDTTTEKLEKAKALKKLVKKWLTTAETKRKAAMVLAKNPELKPRKANTLRKEE